MSLPSAVVCIIENERGEVLILNRNYKPLGWGLPGGKVEEGEKLVGAVIREVKEETGIDLKPESITFVKWDSATDGRIVFIYKTFRRECPVTLSPEHSQYVWVNRPITGIELAGRTNYYLSY